MARMESYSKSKMTKCFFLLFFALFSCFNMRKKYWLKLEHLRFCVLAISYSKLEYFEVEGIDAEVLFNPSYMKMLLCYDTCDSVVSLLSTSYSNVFAISYSNLKFFTSGKIMFNLEVISISQKVLACWKNLYCCSCCGL